MAHILIAEDEAPIYKFISFRLQKIGHSLCWAQNGGQVVELVQQEQPDIILLDVMMPVHDGFQVLRMLKADPELQRIPVIMLTARGHANDVSIGFEGGADDYLVKPFNFPDLVTRINALLLREGKI
jgi:DNA-binding response OmpR family regulator